MWQGFNCNYIQKVEILHCILVLTTTQPHESPTRHSYPKIKRIGSQFFLEVWILTCIIFAAQGQ